MFETGTGTHGVASPLQQQQIVHHVEAAGRHAYHIMMDTRGVLTNDRILDAQRLPLALARRSRIALTSQRLAGVL